MSNLSYAKYEDRLAAQEARARQKARDNYKPYMACRNVLALLSIEYKPTIKGTPRWIGQVSITGLMVNDLPISLWQEDIDFLNRVTGLNIGTETMNLKGRLIDVMTYHCHPKFGLNGIDYINYKATHYQKGDPMPAPTPTPIAQAKPQKRGYLHLRDLLRKNGVVALSANDPLLAKIKRLASLGYCTGGKHNIWTATPVTVAPVEVLPAVKAKAETQFKVGQVVQWISARGLTTETYVISEVVELTSTWYKLQHPYMSNIKLTAKAENIVAHKTELAQVA